MNFSALHQQVKQQTDASLLTLIDELPDYAPRLKDAMRHALLAGGKRMRPLLVQVVGNTLDVPKKDQMELLLHGTNAAAIQLCYHHHFLPEALSRRSTVRTLQVV